MKSVRKSGLNKIDKKKQRKKKAIQVKAMLDKDDDYELWDELTDEPQNVFLLVKPKHEKPADICRDGDANPLEEALDRADDQTPLLKDISEVPLSECISNAIDGDVRYLLKKMDHLGITTPAQEEILGDVLESERCIEENSDSTIQEKISTSLWRANSEKFYNLSGAYLCVIGGLFACLSIGTGSTPTITSMAMLGSGSATMLLSKKLSSTVRNTLEFLSPALNERLGFKRRSILRIVEKAGGADSEYTQRLKEYEAEDSRLLSERIEESILKRLPSYSTDGEMDSDQ